MVNEKMKELNMFVEDFGLIKEAEITLKPLTIFLGENNTGKSYIAQLIYALTRSVGNLRIPSDKYTNQLYQRIVRGSKYDGNTINAFTRRLPNDWEKTMESGRELVFEVPFSDLPLKMRNDCVELVKNDLQNLRIYLEKELKEAYGIRSINELNTKLKGGRNFLVKIEHDRPLLKIAFRAEKNHLSQEGEISFSFRGVRIHPEISTLSMRRMIMQGKLSPRETVKWLIFLTIVSSMNNFAGVFPKNAYYLPAARSGILQGQKLIARAGLSSLKRAGMSAMSMSKLPGVVIDFLDQIYSIDKYRKGDFGNLSKNIEQSLTAGAVGIIEKKEELPEIYFDVKETGRFPLHRTSSMVSELAPIILMLRYLIERNDIVILEEPESHLHPKLQREFARIIANFVRSGIFVLITTHSDYFVEQLGNVIALSSQAAEVKKRLGYKESDIIYENEVSAYRFLHRRDGFTAVEALRIDKYGISNTGFGDVAEGLYEESIEAKRRRS
jgi:predicted ATPase